MPDLPSGTVTFLFTDIEGSTALWERDRAAMRTAVARHLAILQSAVAAHRGVLYKTLGATRGRIVSAELLEFGMLGLATAVLAIIIATVTAWALCKFAFDIPFVFTPLAAAQTIALALALVLAVGAITTWRVLSVKAAPYLRAE